MKSHSLTTPVKGGWVMRNAESGRFMAVRTHDGAAVSRPKSTSAIKEASSKRSDALKRLKDR